MSTTVFSVFEITRRIKELLETEIDRVWVTGEVSSLKVHPSSGHAYFNLKDERAVIACTLWATTLRRLAHRPQEGMRIRAFGQISVYEPRGTYQLNVQQLMPDGEGALQAAFLALKRKLEAEGLFDPARKRPIPAFPRRIGIVTSASGAALRDMLRILGRRWPVVEVVLRPAAVQGPGAALELAQAVRDLNEIPDLDLLVIGRGGGSLEDLWAFNEEPLARAIHTSNLPVISAVGHEVDFTICDFVADLRAATPTHAAEMAVPDQEEIRRRLARDGRGLRLGLARRLEQARHRFDRARLGRGLRLPEELIRRGRLDLDRASDRLRAALAAPTDRSRQRLLGLERRLAQLHPTGAVSRARAGVSQLAASLERRVDERVRRAHARTDLAAARLEALSPMRVLGRGYSIVRRTEDRGIVRLASDARTGDGLEVTLAQGRLQCRVESSELHAGPTGRGAVERPSPSTGDAGMGKGEQE